VTPTTSVLSNLAVQQSRQKCLSYLSLVIYTCHTLTVSYKYCVLAAEYGSGRKLIHQASS